VAALWRHRGGKRRIKGAGASLTAGSLQSVRLAGGRNSAPASRRRSAHAARRRLARGGAAAALGWQLGLRRSHLCSGLVRPAQPKAAAYGGEAAGLVRLRRYRGGAVARRRRSAMRLAAPADVSGLSGLGREISAQARNGM